MAVSKHQISLKKASGISGYHPDYLGSLIRSHKIKGGKIGRDWFTTEEDLRKYLFNRRFFLAKDLLFQKISKKTSFVILAVFLLSLFVFFLVYNPKTHLQKLAGDFISGNRTQEKSFLIDEASSPKEIKITSYMSDDRGNIGIAVEPESARVYLKKEKSFFQKINEFFSKAFK
jgi:hypothetical protein